MTETVAAVLALAVVDSINPSALVVAIYLLTQANVVARLLAYVAGILASYFAFGCALMLGAGALFERFGAALDHPVVWGMQAALGAVLLACAVFAPKRGPNPPPPPPAPRAGGLAGMVLLGATVTALELVTALPYFGAIALMVGAGLPASAWLPLLLVYNLVFVLPPLALLGLHLAFGSRLRDRYGAWQARLQAGAREALLWIFGIVGVGLLVDAAARFRAAG
ncbi:MAG: GAP family protein [Pseudoxanthomonas sp.]|nr:GAP family protein [Pseudoxanthomonas sp.]